MHRVNLRRSGGVSIVAWIIVAVSGAIYGAFIGESFERYAVLTLLSFCVGAFIGYSAEAGGIVYALLSPRDAPDELKRTGSIFVSVLIGGIIVSSMFAMIGLLDWKGHTKWFARDWIFYERPHRLVMGAVFGMYILYLYPNSAKRRKAPGGQTRPKKGLRRVDFTGIGKKNRPADENKPRSMPVFKRPARKSFDTAQENFEYGKKVYNTHHYKDALRYFSKAIEMERKAVYYFYCGLAYQKSDQHRSAEIKFRKAIEMSPGVAVYYNSRALSRMALGELESAVDDLTRALELDPEFGNAYFNRARAYDMLKMPDKSKQDMLEAARLGHPGIRPTENG